MHNSTDKLTRASSSRCRHVLQGGLVFAAVFSVILLMYITLPDGQYDFSAPAPLPVSWVLNHNLEVSLPQQSVPKAGSISKPAKILSPAEKSLLEKQQELLSASLHGSTFHSSLHVKNKSDLIPAEGGHPVRNLIVSTWRSGSSFLDSVVATTLGTFLLYEPFMGFELHPEEAKTTSMAKFLDEVFRCNFKNKDHFFDAMKKRQWALALNEQFWPVCKEDVRTCVTESYHEAACELFPFVLIKTVRLWMNETRQLLQDDSLRLRVLLLVRDPRGSMASRYRATSWCIPNKKCGSEDYLCDFLESNYYAAKELMAQFPGRVKVIRYEDLMLDPYTTIRQVFDFFRLFYGEEVHSLLQKEDRYSAYSTVTPKRGLYYWTEELTFEQVSFIQSKCEVPLKLYGYKTAHNATHLRSMNPLGNFTM